MKRFYNSLVVEAVKSFRQQYQVLGADLFRGFADLPRYKKQSSRVSVINDPKEGGEITKKTFFTFHYTACLKGTLIINMVYYIHIYIYTHIYTLNTH